ncbi:MAG: hypothetical protein RL764_1597 [Pseudomonadota bacterium]|jgi:SM-20-related protein
MHFSHDPHVADQAAHYAAILARDGIVQIPNFLPEKLAEKLYLFLQGNEDWHQIINSGEKTFELPRMARSTMSDTQKTDLDTAIYAGARFGFQYRYETIRVPDSAEARADKSDPLTAFAQFMTQSAQAGVLQSVVGRADIILADAQATAYSPGDFLTRHDDAVAGKGRVAAYVMGLTPGWRIEWGGLLLVHQDDGVRVDGYCPAFNTITLFTVPILHSVSEVTRAAPYRRISVTGWLRTNN